MNRLEFFDYIYGKHGPGATGASAATDRNRSTASTFLCLSQDGDSFSSRT